MPSYASAKLYKCEKDITYIYTFTQRQKVNNDFCFSCNLWHLMKHLHADRGYLRTFQTVCVLKDKPMATIAQECT